ncbi:MAG: Tetratricopeptide repeat protein [Candidatus Hydrogenedentes bacterium ADurb.Bin170]|nr:MAG: Tetratricopeptide repeat protein [Candidatus Hydrogenedentes bacterium ADurb.Bin170]
MSFFSKKLHHCFTFYLGAALKRVFLHPLIPILIIGFLLRIYRLPYQSIWLDDWLPYMALQNSDLLSFLRLFKTVIPEHACTPVFYILLFLWSKLIGTAPFALKLLPLIIGTFSIVLIFILGTILFSRRAGLISALLLAFSPPQIWFSQEFRPYSLMLFLALCSLLALEQALSSSRRPVLFWTLYYCSTVLFVFNHLFSLLILVPHGIYILLRRGWRCFFLWSLPCFVLLCFLFFSAFNISHSSIGSHTLVGKYSLWEAIAQATAKDIVSRHADLLPVWANNPPAALPDFLNILLLFRPYLDVALYLFVFFGLVLFFIFSYKTIISFVLCGSNLSVIAPRFIRTNKQNPSENFPSAKFLIIILLIYFSAIALALLQNVTGRAVAGTSYDAYNMAGVYLALGFVISKIKKRTLYKAAVFLILFFYGYQCLIFLPYRTRPEWQGAADYIRKHASPQDLIIDDWSLLPFSSRVRPFLDDLNIRKEVATSRGDICEQTKRFFQEEGPTSPSSPKVWVITEPVFSKPLIRSGAEPLSLLLAEFQEMGFQIQTISFLGGSHLTVIKVAVPPHRPIHTFTPYSQVLNAIDYDHFFSDLGIVPQNANEESLLKASCQRATDVWPPIYTHTNLGVGFSFLRQKEYRLAGAFARYLLRSHPYYGLGYYYMGTLLALAGEKERAQAYFTEAFSLYPVVESYSGGFSRELCRPGNTLPGKNASDRLSAFPYQFFVDLERYINETAIPFGDGPENRMLPESERAKLAAELSEGKVIIETLFSAQDSLATTEGWLPITKRLPAFWAEALCLFTGDAEKAANKYRALIARFPFERLFYDRYDFYLKHYAGGSEYAEKWLDLVSVNPDLAAYAIKKLEETGQLRLQQEQEEDALAAFETALSLGSDSISTAAKAGDLYARANRWQEALTAYAVVLKKEPYFENTLDKADEILNRLNDENITRAYWKDIQESNSAHWEVVRRYGAALENEKRYDEAAAIYLSIKDSAEHGCYALLAGARCLRLASNAQQAFNILNMQDPERCHPPKLLSYEYILSGQQLTEEHLLAEATQSFLKATEVGGFDELAYFGLGSIALQRGDTEGALDYFRKSVDADPENIWHRQCLAVEQQKAGRYQEALENLKILLEKSPDNEGLRQSVLSLVQEHRDLLREDTVQDLFASFPDWFSLPPSDN